MTLLGPLQVCTQRGLWFLNSPGSDGPSAVPDSLSLGGTGPEPGLEEGTWLSLVRDLLGAWHPPD